MLAQASLHSCVVLGILYRVLCILCLCLHSSCDFYVLYQPDLQGLCWKPAGYHHTSVGPLATCKARQPGPWGELDEFAGLCFFFIPKSCQMQGECKRKRRARSPRSCSTSYQPKGGLAKMTCLKERLGPQGRTASRTNELLVKREEGDEERKNQRNKACQ